MFLRGQSWRVRRSIICKWLCIAATSGFLFQATTGCPNGDMIKGAAATGVQGLVNGILGLYVKNAVNTMFGS